MADKNIVMASADEIRATGYFDESAIQAAMHDDGGYVGEADVEKVGLVKYYITLRRTARLPDQYGDRRGYDSGAGFNDHVNAE